MTTCTVTLAPIQRKLETMTDNEARQLVWYIFGQSATLTDAWGTCQLDRFEQAVNACLFSNPQ